MQTLDSMLQSAVSAANALLWDWGLSFLLVASGVFFTIKLGFVQFREVRRVFSILRKKKNAEGDGLTSYEVFCISTGARVGVGNIAGIAIALAVGGPGAIFWMWAAALTGAASGFIESTLAQLYKIPHADGTFSGGPAAYIKAGLSRPGLAAVFAITLAAADGLIFNSVLSNTLALQTQAALGAPVMATGIVLSLYAAAVVSIGPKRLGRLSAAMLPLMLALYLGLAAWSAVVNFERIPEVFSDIIRAAFDWQAAGGAAVAAAFMTGVRRGLYSNEAGQGTVPNAAAAAQTDHPVEQGVIQSFGVFVDTMIVCTASAFIILLFPGWSEIDKSGIELVYAVLESSLGPAASFILFACVVFFALTSVVGNFFYSDAALKTVSDNRFVHAAFRAAVIAMVFAGSQMSLELAWGLADLFLGTMALINAYALFKLLPQVRALLADYRAKIAAGAEMSFKASDALSPLEASRLSYWRNKD